MAIKPRTRAGLKTVFGLDWGRPVSLIGDVGGKWSAPDGARPDEPLGLIVYGHGFGGTYTTGTSQLALTERRAANRGSGFVRLSVQGFFSLGGSEVTNSGGQRTFNGPDSLLPLNNSKPWAASTNYVRGDRVTNGNGMWCAMNPVAGLSASSGAGPSGIGNVGSLVTDGAVQWRSLTTAAMGVGDNRIPDIDIIAGRGRTVNGIVYPKGVVREFIETSGLNIDLRKIWFAGYSTSGGLAYVLLRHHSDLFAGAIVQSGVDCTGPNADHNYAAPAYWSHLLHFHGTADGQVNDEDVPPNTSTAATGPHPGQQTSVQQLMREMGQAPGSVVVDTGVTADFTATVGAESQIWAPASDVVDPRGNTIRARMVRMVADGHTPGKVDEWARFCSSFVDDNPRTPPP
jgi:hypothetical protein